MIEPIPSDVVKNYEHITIVNKLNELIAAFNRLTADFEYSALPQQKEIKKLTIDENEEGEIIPDEVRLR